MNELSAIGARLASEIEAARDRIRSFPRGERHWTPNGFRLESALGRYLNADQIAKFDAAQARALAPFDAIPFEHRGGGSEPHDYDTCAACMIGIEGIVSIDPYASLYIDIGGE